MTIEIADRLIKLRKKHGYSQEELADKLGLSRQAVSKWERAEASPDTDNLICLAKLYGVSLDELLSTNEDVETIVKEQIKEDKEDNENRDSITLTDEDGSKVVITNHNFNCCDENGKHIKRSNFHKDRFSMILDIVDASLSFLALLTYIFLGVFLNMWANGWVFFFIPEIICSIIRAIRKKNPNKVNMAFISLFTFFFVCMVLPGMNAHLWHPMWVVFLAIPAYHTIFGSINRIRGKNEEEED